MRNSHVHPEPADRLSNKRPISSVRLGRGTHLRLGGPHADRERAAESSGWQNDGELVHTAATLHPQDDDFGQAGTLYRDVMDDAAKERLLAQITGHVGAVVNDEIRARAIAYWTNVDAGLGAKLGAALAVTVAV